jgi:hypothetical protein
MINRKNILNNNEMIQIYKEKLDQLEKGREANEDVRTVWNRINLFEVLKYMKEQYIWITKKALWKLMKEWQLIGIRKLKKNI